MIGEGIIIADANLSAAMCIGSDAPKTNSEIEVTCHDLDYVIHAMNLPPKTFRNI